MIIIIFLFSTLIVATVIRSNYKSFVFSLVVSYFINIGLFSGFYVISLIIGLKFFTFSAIIVGMLFVSLFFLNGINIWLNRVKDIEVTKFNIFLVFAFIWIFTVKFISKTEFWGEWDAWAIWTMHAKFLYQSNFYPDLLPVYVDTPHPDYPLMLSGIIACFWKGVGDINAFIPFLVAYLNCFLLVLACIYVIYKRHGYLAALGLAIFFTWTSFLYRFSASQYADTLLATFFVLPFLNSTQKNIGNDNLVSCFNGFFAAGAGWIKNEGVVFFIIYTLYVLIWQRDNKKSKIYYFFGAIFPILFIVLTKSIFPGNDIVNEERDFTVIFDKISDVTRYVLIFKQLAIELIKMPFLLFIGCVTVFYNVIYFQTKEFYIIVVLMAVYFVIYLVTPHDLQWHLSSSLDRLIFQISPLFVMSSLYSINKISVNIAQTK